MVGSLELVRSATADPGWPLLVLACPAGLGGGVLRDVLIGAVPPVGISDWRLMSAACAAGVVTFFLHPRVSRIRRTVLLLDAVGLGVFAVADLQGPVVGDAGARGGRRRGPDRHRRWRDP